MRLTVLTTCLLLCINSSLATAQDTETVSTTQVREHVYMLQGNGGNIGISVGDDGIFMIDDQYAPMTPQIREAIAAISDEPLRFILNTHWHQDHTGGNENFGSSGAIIVAHDNVRKRMSSEQFIAAFNKKVPASPAGALPVVTFSDTVTFHLNGDTVHAFHVNNGHTDGDTVIRFRQANVIHTGDIYFNGLYPFIDVSSGGSVDGVIKALDRILRLANDDTRIIPGHGPLGDKAGLSEYRDMLKHIRDGVQKLITQGKTLEQIQANRPTADYDDEWGNGFISPDAFVAIVYSSLTAD